MDPQVGQIINNKYRLERLIGDGGMGSVFEARHELLGTTVALKFLHTALSRRKGLVERFLQEAQVSARIDSPHVVRVSDVDRMPGGLAYMVMEYVDGKTLQALYENLYRAGKQLSYGDAFAIMLQLLDGVGAAHKLNIVHRDLKPDNVMLTHDSKSSLLVKILDFGIAKLKASGEVDRGLTRPGVVMGTPEYMAPEQAFSADKVDVRADIFSLGVMFFEMLAGRRPVGGDNAHSIAAQYLEGGIAQLRELKPSISQELAAAVHRAMSAEPSARFDSVEQLRDAIRPFAPGGASASSVKASPELADTLDEQNAAAEAAAEASGAVPKTIPPEETFDSAQPGDSGDSGSHGAANDAADSGEETLDEATAAIGGVAPAMTAEPGELSELETATTDAAAEAVDDPTAETLQSPDTNVHKPQRTGGGTIAMQDAATGDADANAAVDAIRGGTEMMPPGAVAGSTQIGDAELPAELMRDHGSPAQAMPGPAPLAPSPYVGGAAPAAAAYPLAPPARQGKKGGKRGGGMSFLSILLLAAGISGAVVGGVYLAHRASQQQDSEDDPPALQTKPPARPKPVPASRVPEPVPTNVAPTPLPPTPMTPPRPRPQPPRPKPQPPTPQPPQPPPTFPTVLPSAFPTLPFPFPGQPQPPAPQPPAPQPPGPTPPSPGPGPGPSPRPPTFKFPKIPR